MIRYVFIAAMLAVLGIVLYIPSAVPPERFLDIVRAEHEVTERVLGPEAAQRILSRTLDMQQVSAPVSTPPATWVHSTPSKPVDAAMVAQVSQMSMRLFGNPYFRSIDALFVLVSYRVAAAVELMPLLSIFFVVVAIDGFVIRKVRAKEFIAHSAEMFGGSIVVAITLSCSVVVACFLPYQLHPMFVTLALLATLFVLSRALANYHAIH